MGVQSSKLPFRSCIDQLATTSVEPSAHEFWDELWKSSLSAEDIFETITIEDIRKIVQNHPMNVKIMFIQAVAQLYQVVETPYPVYFDQALTCIRILARISPFLIHTSLQDTDKKENETSFVWDLLWSRQRAKPQKTENESQPQDDSPEPLAVILINTVFHLLFLPDFTIEDPDTDFSEKDVDTVEFKTALMWAPGVGSVSKSVSNSSSYDQNRIEVLRLMVSIFSDALYRSPEEYDPCDSLWLEIATSVEIPYAEIFFNSLMNTVLGYDPIGWGLPYGNLVATDTAKELMESAVQVLVLLLDYGFPVKLPSSIDSAPSIAGVTYVDPKDIDSQGFNIFRRILSTIEAPDQLNFIYRGFVRLLNNLHQSESSYLPYSISKVNVEQELLVLLWKCLEEIPKFLNYILRHCDINELVVPICYIMIEGRKDPAKIGLMYLCTFILLKFSGERNFGVNLNKSYNIQLPIDLPAFTGNHADLLIITLHKMIISGMDKLSSLYNCFLTIICNISPYCKSLCSIAAVKLVNLFQLFTSPKFLYGAEGNHIYVSMLLETFNNIIQYQYEGNVNIIYAIIRRKEVFENLANLTLPIAIKSAVDVAEKKQINGNVITNNSEEELIAEHQPTDLISTTHVERTITPTGDVQDVHASTSNSIPSTKPLNSKFTPSQIWLEAVKSELPLNTIIRLLKHLIPQIEDVATKNQGRIDEIKVLEFIQQTTMVGLLPVPHPIVIRKYQPNKYTCLWFTVYTWGVIFMHNQELNLFESELIKLFVVQTV